MTNSLTPLSSSSHLNKFDFHVGTFRFNKKSVSKVAMGISIVCLLALASCSFLLVSLGFIGGIVGGSLALFFGLTFIVSAIKFCQKTQSYNSTGDSTGDSIGEISSSIDESLSEADIHQLSQMLSHQASIHQRFKLMRKNIDMMTEIVSLLNTVLSTKEEELNNISQEYYALEDSIPLIESKVRAYEADIASKLESVQSIRMSIEKKRELYKEYVQEKMDYKKKHSFCYKIKPKFKKIEKAINLLYAELAELNLTEKDSQDGLLKVEESLDLVKKELESVNNKFVALGCDYRKLQQLVDEEHQRYFDITKVLLKEKENLQKVEQDIDILKHVKLILKGEVEIPNNFDACVLQTIDMVPIDGKTLLKGPLLEQKVFNFPFSSEVAELEISDELGDFKKDVSQVDIYKNIRLSYEFYKEDVLERSFNQNSHKNNQLETEFNSLLKKKGVSFIKKIFKFFSNPMKEILKDFTIFKLRSSSSDFFSFIEMMNTLMSSHSSLDFLYILMMNSSVRKELLPMINILNEKSAAVPDFFFYINFVFNALINSIFINPNWSHQDFTEFCLAIGVTEEVLIEHVNNGKLLTLVLEKVLLGSNIINPLDSLEEIKNTSLNDFFNSLIPICHKKSMHDPVQNGVMTVLLSQNLTIEDFFKKAPHLLAWLKMNLLEKISMPKRKIISIIKSCKGLTAIGESLLSVILVYQLYPIKDLAIFCKATKCPKKKWTKAIQEKKLLSLMLSLV